jgi:hypothetical protein
MSQLGVGHWHPHLRIFAPYYDNSMLGSNEFGSPLPQVSDDAGNSIFPWWWFQWTTGWQLKRA